ncbi:MAG TPA: hypothetical protein VLC46_14405 [Thermoanaerobaculia bacterium]|jgi:hypothetical protein|nr:hypothetical protein [Thermoanaerobaculia bacterium]
MSTGYQHHEKAQNLSFDSIDSAVKAFDIVAFSSENEVQTLGTRTERLVNVYQSVRPIILALSTIPLIPAAWRALLAVFAGSMDDLSATFKAGKDLATSPVDAAPKADMEPKLPVG